LKFIHDYIKGNIKEYIEMDKIKNNSDEIFGHEMIDEYGQTYYQIDESIFDNDLDIDEIDIDEDGDYDTDDKLTFGNVDFNSNKINIVNMIPAEDSRMPDVMSVFEAISMCIARSTAISSGSAPRLNTGPEVTPIQNAKLEILHGKTCKSILRVDSEGNHNEWKATDFIYFPTTFFEEVADIKIN
jgi:hypothetical protein